MLTLIAHHWLTATLLLFLLASTFGSGLTFDALLKYEYKFCRDQWEADGSLPGLFWTVPDAANMFAARIAGQSLIWRWLFRTPDWISGIKPLERKLRLFRLLWIVSTLAALSLVIASVAGMA